MNMRFMNHTLPPRFEVDRRAVALGVAASSLLGLSGLASAQSVINEVPLEKLMAPDGLEELSLGNENAGVTIIEYASMSCPACAHFHRNTYPELKRKYVDTGKVRLIIREFPLNNLAAAGSMLARCAGTTSNSIAFIDVLFDKQREWVKRDAVAALLNIARQAGFTEASFNSCLQDDKLLAKLSRRRDRASREFGVNATPSFFINGKRLRTRNYSIEAFDGALEPLLKST